MRRFALLAAMVLLWGVTSVAHADDPVTVRMGGGRDFGEQTGTATLTDVGGQTQVELNLSVGPAGATTPQPAHIHVGQCPGVGAVAHPLTFPVNGKSSTTINATLASLQTGGFAINAHKSAAEAAVYTSCGNIPARVSALPRTGDSELPMWVSSTTLAALILVGAGLMLRRRTAQA